jgi:hypothetical protein
MFNIIHGGWIPKGRKTEDGTLPDKYRLKEMPTSSYPARTEKNVLDSDGTVIFSNGPLTGGSKLTQKLAKKNDKPNLHIDFNKIPDHNAVFLVRKWMFENNIEILNVAGPRASGDPQIYDAVYRIIKGVYWTDKIKGQNQVNQSQYNPRSVDEVVDQIIADFSLRDKVETANLAEEDLYIIKAVLGIYVGEKVDEWLINNELHSDLSNDLIDAAEASKTILEKIWERLRETHRLRVIKKTHTISKG